MSLKTIPIGYIRGLLIAQNGRCAISGVRLHAHELNADHIVPLSRADLCPTLDEKNLWLVQRNINLMKGTMTYIELIQSCELILKNQTVTKKLLEKIQKGKIQPLSKEEFDVWTRKHFPNG